MDGWIIGCGHGVDEFVCVSCVLKTVKDRTGEGRLSTALLREVVASDTPLLSSLPLFL